MKALSIWQPRASLVAAGLAGFEIRTWAPPRYLIGQRIAIHAAQRQPAPAEVRALLIRIGSGIGADAQAILDDALCGALPLGAVLATAILVAAYRCGGAVSGGFLIDGALSDGNDPVLIEADAYGDFSPGCWAWLLADAKPLAKPNYTAGHQNLWTWHAPFHDTAPLPAPATEPGGTRILHEEDRAS